MNNSARQIIIKLWTDKLRLYLTPGDQSRTDIEWLGTIERDSGETGALGRLTNTGALVQVNAGSTRTLDQRAAELALSIARGDTTELLKLIANGGYSKRGAAKELQISERMMRYYCSGEQPVPRVVMLAMRHLVQCPPTQNR